jgi:cytochrome c biogenesis protein CcdA
MDLFTAMAVALWLGILTSISPCPLATNIAAITFVSHRISNKGMVFLSGVSYTLGRSIAYILLGFLIAKAMVSLPILSFFLQKYINSIMGLLLIIVGMVLLDMLKMRVPAVPFLERAHEKLRGIGGSFLLGILFALAFCPVSAALFFGSLIPMTIKADAAIGLPLLYGIGTGAPVLAVAALISAGSRSMDSVYQKLAKVELYAKKLTGIIFILVGVYYVLVYIFGII